MKIFASDFKFDIPGVRKNFIWANNKNIMYAKKNVEIW